MKQLNDKDTIEAFESDWGEVSFDHEPTQEEIFLIKLKLVARKAEQNLREQVVRAGVILNPDEENGSMDVTFPCGFWQELKRGAE